MNNVHFTDVPMERPHTDPILSRKGDLMHLDMLKSGVYLARRGMMNLSLPMTDTDIDFAVSAFEEFLDSRRAILK